MKLSRSPAAMSVEGVTLPLEMEGGGHATAEGMRVRDGGGGHATAEGMRVRDGGERARYS